MYCRFNDACCIDNKLYASACNMNGLFSIDIKTHRVDYIASFPQDPLLCFDLHSRVISVGDTLIFIPLNGTGISVVSLPSYTFTFIASEVKYVNAIIYKDFIYLIPYKLSDGVWKYLIEDKILVKTDIDLLTQNLSLDNDITTDWYGSLIVDDYLYIVISGTGNIIKVNLTVGGSKWICFEGVQFANIAYLGEWFYITHNQYPYIYKTKMKKNSLIKIEIPEEKRTRSIYRVVEYNHYIICIPCFSDTIYRYDTNSNNFQILHSIQNNGRIDNCQSKYAGIVMIDGKLVLLPKGDSRMVELDKESVALYELCFNNVLKTDDKQDGEILLFEKKSFGLADYIQIF